MFTLSQSQSLLASQLKAKLKNLKANSSSQSPEEKTAAATENAVTVNVALIDNSIPESVKEKALNIGQKVGLNRNEIF